jgi:hypothetical protein
MKLVGKWGREHGMKQKQGVPMAMGKSISSLCFKRLE